MALKRKFSLFRFPSARCCDMGIKNMPKKSISLILVISLLLASAYPLTVRPVLAVAADLADTNLPPRSGPAPLYFIHTDHLGSTTLITDSQGNEVSRYAYYPYGSFRSPSVNRISGTTDYLFTGQKRDTETGLDYFNARYYSPELGMFISADKAQGPNRYLYVGGNPIMRTDPSGNMMVEDGGGGGGGGGIGLGISGSDTSTPIQATSPFNSTLQGGMDNSPAGWAGMQQQAQNIQNMALMMTLAGGGGLAAPPVMAFLAPYYIYTSFAWSNFAAAHPKIAMASEVGSAVMIGASPSNVLTGVPAATTRRAGLKIFTLSPSKVDTYYRKLLRLDSDIPSTAKTFEGMVDGTYEFTVATVKGELAGYASVYYSENMTKFLTGESGLPYLNKVFVSPEFRRQGIATALVQFAIEGKEKIWLLNAPGKELWATMANVYTRLGFVSASPGGSIMVRGIPLNGLFPGGLHPRSQ